jgi:hypothetical protein
VISSSLGSAASSGGGLECSPFGASEEIGAQRRFSEEKGIAASPSKKIKMETTVSF